MYKHLKVSLVIPAYNEEKLIVPTLENVPKIIDKVYVVDDASTDNTHLIVNKLIQKDKRITLLRHQANKGTGNAIITGYKQSSKDGHDIAVVIGGDNQMDLADLNNFLEPIANNEADYTKGNRFLLGGNAYTDMPKKRFFGNAILTFMTKFASGYWKIFDTQDGYTAISKRVIDKVDWSRASVGYGYVSDFLILFNVYNIRVKDVPRKAIYLKGERQSQIKIFRYMITVGPRIIKKFFWRINTKYLIQDFHPLILFYYFSFVLLPLGTILAFKVGYQGLTGLASGNLAVLSALLLIMGTQFLLFAILFDMQANQ
ncbi:glycosyltransferase family 2 protein [Candidatus Woesearchaeota archaeon]|nr:glycosyltransferase family 2 protein [Candidatus Woesearchaeota archaeon]